MTMIKELDCVALTAPLPEHGLEVGDVGAVVHVFGPGESFMVEFTTFGGKTVAVPKVSRDQIRLVASEEIHHTRPFKQVA